MSDDPQFHTPESLINRYTEKGRTISISFEIVDPDKARAMFQTMYGVGIDDAGIRVTRWGFYDILTIQEQKLKYIQELTARFLKDVERAVNNSYDKDPAPDEASKSDANYFLERDVAAFVAKMKEGEA